MSTVSIRAAAVRDLLGRYLLVFSEAWRARKSYEAPRRTRDELAFLPAVLALRETPVSPAPRVAFWVLILLLMTALTWAVLSKIEVVAVAQGKIVPNDRSKTVQSMESAVIRSIRVRDGQRVVRGEVLIQLDSTGVDADVATIRNELAIARLQVARGNALLIALDTGYPPKLAAKFMNDKHAHLLLARQYEEYQANLAKLTAESESRAAALEAAREMVRNLEISVPISRARASDLRKLADQNLVPRQEFLQREQERLEQETNLVTQRSGIASLQAMLRGLKSERQALTFELSRSALASIEEGQQKISALEQDLLKATSKGQFMTLVAPVTGTVQQLMTHTVGGVVTSAQPLMTIVPENGALEIEAFLENKDVGFVREGQSVTVKVATFPYTKYGTIEGSVVAVSRDAIEHEKLGPIYAIRVRMIRDGVTVDGKRVGLGPGMATTVEIKTGTRRVIEYFLSPLLQRANESLRER